MVSKVPFGKLLWCFSLRIWKQNDGKYELEINVQGEHERNIYSVNWSERGILTGSGDNKIRLFVEQDDQTWICTKTIELKADINSGKIKAHI